MSHSLFQLQTETTNMINGSRPYLRILIERFFLALFLSTSLLLANAQAAEQKNVLLICVDDLRPELASFGASYIKSPNVDQLAKRGTSFHRHYVNAPSCGPSRFTLLTGRFGAPGNMALFARAQANKKSSGEARPSMPEWFRKLGFTTVSVGKVSHHPGGLGGKDWDDPEVVEMPGAWDRHLMPVGDWQHPRGTMHGLANGEIRVRGQMSVIQATEGPDSIYPDGLIVDKALQQLDLLSSDKSKPFFLAVGLIKPHLPFGCPKKYLDLYAGVTLPAIPHPDKPKGLSTWHKSGEFFKGYSTDGKDPREDQAFADEVRRHYAACVSYADASVGRIIERLRQTGEDKNTIIVLWGDHGWNLGEHGIWGKHNLFEEALRSPLIVVEPGDTAVGQKTMAIVETLDIFPTICELAEVSKPDFVEGVSLVPIMKDPGSTGRPAIGYTRDQRTLRTQTHRLILHKNGGVELYDHTSPEKETKNIAQENSELVDQLTTQLNERLSRVRDR